MTHSIYDKVLKALHQAENHNSQIMVKPEVILWPDPEKQWEEVMAILQEALPQLLIYGDYEPAKKQGPAIWLKCMVTKNLPEADWGSNVTPIIYLPGVSKQDLRNVENAVFNFQPLLEYQYTGTTFLQENGREWTVLAFLENQEQGLGLKVVKDAATKDALVKTLPSIIQSTDVFYGKSMVDANFLNSQIFPDLIPGILKWMCRGKRYLDSLTPGKKEVFFNLCRSEYDFEPDEKNIKAIAEKLGSQKNNWKYVWQMYETAPLKYPEIEELLRLAKPADLGTGVFALPEATWPQVNEQKEDELRNGLTKTSKLATLEAIEKLQKLEEEHAKRRSWVWAELGKSPLAAALFHLANMAKKTEVAPDTYSIQSLKDWYRNKGFEVDQSMRRALAAVKSEKDKNTVKAIISLLYQPWLENLALKMQKLVEKNAAIFTGQQAAEESEAFVLFVDAFRFELAEEFKHRLTKHKYKIELDAAWSAIPSLTPTAKPATSPLATSVSTESEITEFRPKLKSGKDLQSQAFKDELSVKGFEAISSVSAIKPDKKQWMEIGDTDTKGHEEQAEMVKRLDEILEQVQEIIETAFDKGVERIKIVTDHGWLLLPGGLPKEQLNAGLTETRWGRCALIKEGATSDLLHLPWRWNPNIYIAYAPGIHFFKANVEYAHGGISLQECLVPVMLIESPGVKKIKATIDEIKWVNLKCRVQTSEIPDGYLVDIRTKYNDEKSSIVLPPKRVVTDNSITLFVDDDAEAQAATVVLMDENGVILDKKATTVGD